MKRVGIVFTLLLSLLWGEAAHASSIVISRVQLGGAATGTSQQEFVQLFNAGPSAEEVTNWCLKYSSSTTVACLTPNASNLKLLLAAQQAVLIGSPQFYTAQPSILQDFSFSTSSNLAATNGSLYLQNANGQEIDRVGWGNGLAENTALAGDLQGGKIFQRKKDTTTNLFIDTNNNAQDFEVASLPASLESHGIVEEEIPDVCPNLPDFQGSVPEGYQLDGDDCVAIPLESRTLQITEMLPDAIGSDEDNEFIEVHNPYNEPIALEDYRLFVGPNYEKSYSFPDNLEISPGQYLAFYNWEVKFSLLNSSSRAKLVAPAGNLVSESESYTSTKEGVSWARFDDGWKMSQKSTPGTENEYEEVVEVDQTTSTLKPCAPGKYRNPETNRCRNLASASGLLKACAADQVRNPETNRCRKIASSGSSLTPCKAGQERNPETNRCRKVGLNAATRKPCQPGYERNPETNRCRKAVATNATLGAPAAINPVSLSNRLVTVLILMALFYALYEYRSDVASFVARLRDKRGNPRPPG